MSGDTYPACDQCTTGHCVTCDGFRDTLCGPADGEPCGCYIADKGSTRHPGTAGGKQAARTARCRENGTHHPQSVGGGDAWCSACDWYGKE